MQTTVFNGSVYVVDDAILNFYLRRNRRFDNVSNNCLWSSTSRC